SDPMRMLASAVARAAMRPLMVVFSWSSSRNELPYAPPVGLRHVDGTVLPDRERVSSVEVPRRAAASDDVTVSRELRHPAARALGILIAAVDDVDEPVRTAGDAPG